LKARRAATPAAKGGRETAAGTKRGRFITFEGGEGAGKSTQIRLLEQVLAQSGIDVLVTREPGGSIGAEAVRQVLLSGAAEPLGAEMEAILFAAARSDHVETIIRPALAAGKTVICDRFFDSTRVYQGATGNVDPAVLRRLEEVACEDCWPDLTIILDIDPEEGMRRAALRQSPGGPDRFEKEALEKHRLRREAYIRIALEEPGRCAIVDAFGGVEEVHERIVSVVMQRLWPDGMPSQASMRHTRSASRKSAK
jgi:dTMP kinase